MNFATDMDVDPAPIKGELMPERMPAAEDHVQKPVHDDQLQLAEESRQIDAAQDMEEKDVSCEQEPAEQTVAAASNPHAEDKKDKIAEDLKEDLVKLENVNTTEPGPEEASRADDEMKPPDANPNALEGSMKLETGETKRTSRQRAQKPQQASAEGAKPAERRQTRRAAKQDVKEVEKHPKRLSVEADGEKKDVAAEGRSDKTDVAGVHLDEADVAGKSEEGPGEDQGGSKKRGRAKGKKEDVIKEVEKPLETEKAGSRQPAKKQKIPALKQKIPAPSASKGKAEEKPAAVEMPHPGSPEFEALSREEREEALMVAIDARERAMESLRAASMNLGDHISSWFKHPFSAGQDAKLVKAMKRVSERRDSSAITKPATRASELWNLWKRLHSLDPATAATLQEQHGVKGLTALNLASFTTSTQGDGGSKPAPPPPAAPSAPAATVAAVAPKEVNGDASKITAPTSSVPPSVIASPQKQQGPPPPPGSFDPRQISLASFRSTGDATRDKTIAALFQAFFVAAAGTTDLLSMVVRIERSLFEATGDREGQSGACSGYIRRSFMIWSLVAPESEYHDEEARRLLLDGQAPDSILANDNLTNHAKNPAS